MAGLLKLQRCIKRVGQWLLWAVGSLTMHNIPTGKSVELRSSERRASLKKRIVKLVDEKQDAVLPAKPFLKAGNKLL